MSSIGVETFAAVGAGRLACGALPQWKRELLERRRSRTVASVAAVAAAAPRDAVMSPTEAPPAALPPVPAPDEEELSYGPGIVQRLKSRYLDLARRQAVERNRRPSLRRAASLDLLEEAVEKECVVKVQPQLQRPTRPVAAARVLRPDIKRARSVDALARLDIIHTNNYQRDDSSRETSDSEITVALSPPPPPLPPPPPPATRSRKPRRASPLLSEAERPPPDLVKSTRRLFETTPRRNTPSANGRIAAAVRGLGITITRPPIPPRTPPASPAPAEPTFHTSTPEPPETPKPPVSASNPITINRIIGVIRPLPALEPKTVTVTGAPDIVQFVKDPECPSEPRVTESPVVTNGIKVLAGKPRWTQNAQQNTMVFNFSNRKDVPDYVENDGMIIKSSKKERLKTAADPGVIVLSSPSLSPASEDGSSGEESGEEWNGWLPVSPPEPCLVVFCNDNVLINGRSSLVPNATTIPTRKYHLKIQFDDSLTRTFEYPSEASLVEDTVDSTVPVPSPISNPLGNSPIINSSLSSFTPSKMRMQPEAFQLGVTRSSPMTNGNSNGDATTNGNGHDRSPPDSPIEEEHYLKPCQDGHSLNWSQETNQGAGDLLF